MRRAMEGEGTAFALTFARAARGYWLGVFPAISRELRRRRRQAREIPDPVLRSQALAALAKRGNMEGAAAFATFAPRAHRDAVIRASVAFQSAYNYLDVLSEQSSAQPFANSRALHQALLVALDPGAPHADYYAHHRRNRDGGYLAGIVEECRAAFAALPSYETVAPAARRAGERVVAFQAHQACGDRAAHGGRDYDDSHGEAGENHRDEGGERAMQRWARAQTPAGSGLQWWETSASAGSSLGVHVMIAAAADRSITPDEVAALEHAYFPWIGALHSLLDHLVDAEEDHAIGQRNLIECYESPQQAVQRMGMLARRSLSVARELGPGRRHELIVAAMACFYLAAPEARGAQAVSVTEAVLDALGPLARPALAVFRARRGVERVYCACRRNGSDPSAESLALAAGRRSSSATT